MNWCPKCGKMFEGSFCPNCGRSLTGERLCPNCKKKVPATAKFCAECGFTLTPQVQPKVKKKSPLDWIKEHKKLVGFGVFVLILIVILAIAIPSVVANRHNGTYYRYENEQYNYDEYFILKGDKYTDESGYSCDVKFDGDNITLYDDLLGIKDEFARGTIKDGVLTLNILGAVATYAEKGAIHEHEFGDWTVQTPSTCIKYGTEMRSCKSCDKTETRAITQLASHKGSWEVTKEATCTETGTRKMHCSVCGQDFSETLDMVRHKSGSGWLFDYTSHWKVCSMCGDNFTLEEHEYDNMGLCRKCQFPNFDTAGLKFIENKSQTGYIVAGMGSANSKVIRIPASYKELPVVEIGSEAFRGMGDLTFVIIPDSVTSIGEGAFAGCSGLTSVSIGSGVTSIGNSAFKGCSGLESVIWNAENCTKAGIYNGGDFTIFNGCTNLKSVALGKKVKTIPTYAFYNCSGLTSVTIGSGLTSIGKDAFYGCNGLKEVHISDLVAWCGIEFGDVDANPLYYARHLFMGGKEVTELKIPNSVTKIGEETFSGCSGLTSVNLIYGQ